VLGDGPLNVFPVKISKTETVGVLRKLIKDEKRPVFDHVTADSLILWKVSIPVDLSLKWKLGELQLDEENITIACG
jgi:hypothetical protein